MDLVTKSWRIKAHLVSDWDLLTKNALVFIYIIPSLH